MAQEGSSDLSMKFSTLNVNAMEFVPSFCTNAPSAAAPTTDSPEDQPPIEKPTVASEPTSQDVSPTKTDEEPPVPVAAPTESIDDKSPDNPGMLI